MARINIPFIISYILTLIFFVIGGIFFRQSFIALIIILLIILPIISIFTVRRIAKYVSIDIRTKTSSVAPGNKIILEIVFNNKSVFPLLNTNISFSFNNMYYPNNAMSFVSLPGIPKKLNTISLSFDTSHLGMNEFDFLNCYITDFMHLYTLTIPVRKVIHVAVMPDEAKTSWNYTIPATFSDDDEDDQFVPMGTLTHDLKETREYQPGDSLKNIHWKLSSKTDDLTVKVFENSAERTILILPELTQSMLDDTIYTVYNFSLNLLKNKEFFKILTFSSVDKDFDYITIETQDDLIRAILSLYHVHPYEMKQYALNTFFELNEKSIFHVLGETITLIDAVSGEKTNIQRKEEV